MASFSSMIATDSQCPCGLDGDAGIKVFGMSQPSRCNKCDNALVPDRCIPSTKMQFRLHRRTSFSLLLMTHQPYEKRRGRLLAANDVARSVLCCPATKWSIVQKEALRNLQQE